MSRPALFRVRAWQEDGSSFDIDATARDVLLWERTAAKGKVFQDLVRSQSMVDMYRIAHIAAVRLGLFTGDLKTFENEIDLENLELGDDEDGEGVDPTRSAQ